MANIPALILELLVQSRLALTLVPGLKFIHPLFELQLKSSRLSAYYKTSETKRTIEKRIIF